MADQALRHSVIWPPGADHGAASSVARDFIVPAALYVHIPICSAKCAYCDFYSKPVSSLPRSFEGELIAAILARSAALLTRFGAKALETVYVGGGTPSLLSPEFLDVLLSGIATLVKGPGSQGPIEWTVEANPDSLGPDSLEIMRARGVTRLSIGVQSLDPVELAILGRSHGPEAALKAVRLAAEAGMTVSADLIAGIPVAKRSQPDFGDHDKLARFARELLGAGARHLSVYDLTIEEGSTLYATRRSLLFPDEDEIWETRRRLEAALGAAGLRRYEVSNYAAIGDECRHNLAYWRMDSYLGAGPGAVSTLAHDSGTSLRILEPKTIEEYARLSGEAAIETVIDLREAVFETLMMAFRTSFGLDLAAFRRRFGIEAEALIGASLSSWQRKIVAGEPWTGTGKSAGPSLNGEGLDLLNRFLGDCLEEMDRSPFL